MQANNCTAQTPLYVASGLLTYMNASGAPVYWHPRRINPCAWPDRTRAAASVLLFWCCMDVLMHTIGTALPRSPTLVQIGLQECVQYWHSTSAPTGELRCTV